MLTDLIPERRTRESKYEEGKGEGRDYLTRGQPITACSQSRTSAREALAAFGGLRSLTTARAVILEVRAIPPKINSRNPIMNNMSDISFASHGNALARELSLEAVRQRAPAVFAASPHERMSPRYTFIPTERVLAGLINVGFMPVDARQTHARSTSLLHARHIVRLRRRFETVQLNDSVLEVLFLNSHDGTSAYQLRIGIFRVVCTNGLIVSRSAFPTQCVAHRGNIVDEVVIGALQMTERFESLAAQIEAHGEGGDSRRMSSSILQSGRLS